MFVSGICSAKDDSDEAGDIDKPIVDDDGAAQTVAKVDVNIQWCGG